MDSDRRYRFTFYVVNPTSSNITAILTFCTSDNTTAFINGSSVSLGDSNGTCNQNRSITFVPGSNVLYFEGTDNNDMIEGYGIGNRWIRANGLEPDWDAYRAALQ